MAGDKPCDAASRPTERVRRKLPAELQKLVDGDDGFYDGIDSSYSVDSTQTPYRYAAYANRIRTILLSAHRYVAYTSDIGESFRPVAHPYIVRTAYGISWTYLVSDVLHEGYKAYMRNCRMIAPLSEAYQDISTPSNMEVIKGMMTGKIGRSKTSSNSLESTPSLMTHIPLIEDYRTVMMQRAVFQSIASMGLPAFTIHSVVKYSGRVLKNSKHVYMRTWAPIGLGLSVVPFLPYIFDKPVEEAVEWAFETVARTYGGSNEVRRVHLPPQGTGPITEGLERQGAKALRQVELEAHKLKSLGKQHKTESDGDRQDLDPKHHQEQDASNAGLFNFRWLGLGGRSTPSQESGDSKKPKSE